MLTDADGMAVIGRYPSNLAATETISFDAFLATRRAGTPVFAESWTTGT